MTDFAVDTYLRLSRFFSIYLDAFADELGKRPKARASILRKLALTELRLRNWRASLAAAAASLKLDPLGTIAHSVRFCVQDCYRRLKGAAGR